MKSEIKTEDILIFVVVLVIYAFYVLLVVLFK